MTTTQPVDAIVAALQSLFDEAFEAGTDYEFAVNPNTPKLRAQAVERVLAHMDGLKKDAAEAAAKEREACALACDKSAQWADDTAVRIRADLGITREYVHHRLIKLVSRMNARAIRARTAAMAEGADRV